MADPTPLPDPSARPRRLWRVVLVVSLALNLAVAGFAIGIVISGPMRGGPPRAIELGIGPMARALAPEDRDAIRDQLRAEGPREGRSGPRTLQSVLAALRADPFVPGEFAAALQDQSDRNSELQARAQAAVVDRVASMSAEQREAFAERLELEARRGGPDRRGPPRQGN